MMIASETELSCESVRSQLHKILESETFARSERLRRFLRLTVSEVLEGRGRQLKEYFIGLEVFDRQKDYDPRIDPIVRVEAHRLRARLDDYYRTEGLEDPIVINLPKGSYAPVFREREAEASTAEGTSPQISYPEDWGSIAVLPFANLSRWKNLEFLCCGIADELIRALAKVEGLRVVSRTSATQSRGTGYDFREIGRQLNVAMVLDGSVQRAGKRLRVMVQLTNAADGRHLWSERYDGEMQDVFAIQDQISQAIANNLLVNLRALKHATPLCTKAAKYASSQIAGVALYEQPSVAVRRSRGIGGPSFAGQGSRF
jgi:adenylate cyclase